MQYKNIYRQENIKKNEHNIHRTKPYKHLSNTTTKEKNTKESLKTKRKNNKAIGKNFTCGWRYLNKLIHLNPASKITGIIFF